MRLRPITFLNAVWGTGRSLVNQDLDNFAPELVVTRIVAATGISDDALRAMTLAEYEGRLFERFPPTGRKTWILPVGVVSNDRHRHGLQYCPACLRDDPVPYLRRTWRLAFATGCTCHSIALHDACPTCGATVQPHRARAIELCYQCARPLADASHTPASAQALRLQHRCETALKRGWDELCEMPLYSHLSFMIIRQVAALLVNGPRAGALRLATARAWGGDPWKTGLNLTDPVLYRNITHGVIAFLMFDQNDPGALDLRSAESVQAVLDQVGAVARQHGTYIMVSVGGSTDYAFLDVLTQVGGDARHPLLVKAVNAVADFVKWYGLDGADLDLECWWDQNSDASKDQGGRTKQQGPHPAGIALTLFAQQLKAVLPGKLVSSTVFASSWYGNNYDPKLADHVDWLGVMTYDLTGSWNQSPVGPHSELHVIRKPETYTADQQGPWPYSGRGPKPGSGTNPMKDNPILSVEEALWYWSNPFFVNWQGTGQQVARNKIAAGVPLYGYDFAYKKDVDPQSGQVPPGYKIVTYRNLASQFGTASTALVGHITIAGNIPRPPFITAPGTYPFQHNIFYETPASATAKMQFLRQIGAEGVIVWELSGDDWATGKSIVEALYAASGNPTVRAPIALPSSGEGAVRQPTRVIDIKGHNSHCFCMCDNSTVGNEKRDIRITHPMKVSAGAPYLYAIISTSDSSANFPDRASLSLTGPDGTMYNRDMTTDNVVVVTSSSSLRCVIVKDPKPGTWIMEVSAGQGVAFHCECNTMPSQDVWYTTAQTMVKRGLASTVGFIGLGLIFGVITYLTLGASLLIAVLVGGFSTNTAMWIATYLWRPSLRQASQDSAKLLEFASSLAPTMNAIVKALAETGNNYQLFSQHRFVQWFGKNFSKEEFNIVVEDGLPVDRVLFIYALVYFEVRYMTDAEEQNAVRHALWQCLLVQAFGEDFATKLGDAHEKARPGTPADNKADEINNIKGQQLARQVTEPYQCFAAARKMWADGQLQTRPDLESDPT